jgi:hypothetical protein
MASTSASDPTVRALRDEMNRLRGRLFQVVEALGLPDKQENAAKGVVRAATYDVQTSVESVLRDRNGQPPR